MSCLEHYFENLLFYGKDVRDEPNKNALTKEQQEAVEICAQYVLYSLFHGQEQFLDYNNKGYIPDACKFCSNHPSNGGSGICNCTLGSPVIY